MIPLFPAPTAAADCAARRFGLALTGRAVEVRGVSTCVFGGDTIVERTWLWGRLSLLERLSAPRSLARR